MCGRYLLRNAPPDATHSPWEEYCEHITQLTSRPRYNICPTQDCIVIRNVDGKRVVDTLPWGFKPHWSKYHPSINARAEGLFDSKMFKGAIKHKRCLIVADGFYEPKGPSGTRNRPWHLFQFKDEKTFAMAGIWLDSGFAVITCAANKQVRDIHDRMPLILEPKHWDRWLDPDVSEQVELVDLLQSRAYQGLVHFEVGNHAKKPGNEGPGCIEPAQ